jgi:hypothetical protein
VFVAVLAQVGDLCLHDYIRESVKMEILSTNQLWSFEFYFVVFRKRCSSAGFNESGTLIFSLQQHLKRNLYIPAIFAPPPRPCVAKPAAFVAVVMAVVEYMTNNKKGDTFSLLLFQKQRRRQRQTPAIIVKESTPSREKTVYLEEGDA